MLGAISPSAAAGLRPICVQCCESEWTSAQACMDRTSATSPNCAPSLGSRPMGQLIPLTMVGVKFVGVTPFTTFKSNMSVWLGAPAIKMKMQFFALFCVAVQLIPAQAKDLKMRMEALSPPRNFSFDLRQTSKPEIDMPFVGCDTIP